MEKCDMDKISETTTTAVDTPSRRRPSRKARESAKKFSDVYKELESSSSEEEIAPKKVVDWSWARNSASNIRKTDKVRPPRRKKTESEDEFIPEEPVPKKTIFACKYCDMVFDNGRVYSSHRLTHVGGDPYFKCGECDKAFRLRGELDRHRKDKHLNERPYVCEQCGWAFKRKDWLLTHQDSVHRGLKPHKCDQCEKCFGTIASLKSHIEARHTEGRKIHLCITCGKAYKMKTHLTTHMKSHNGDGVFSCHICGEQCTSSNQRLAHQRVEHANKIEGEKGSEAFQCKICGIKLKNVSTLNTHFWRHDKQKACTCSLCGERCGTRLKFLQHMRGHNMNLKFPCTTCGTRYNSKKQLEVHELTHTGKANI